MDAMDFFTKVRDDDRLQWDGTNFTDNPETALVYVGCPSKRLHFSMGLKAIREHSWAELRPVLTGYRQPRIMTHMTRIVGYYANLHNFNRSKQQEVIDRRRGDYIIAGDGHVYDRKAAFADSTCLPELQRSEQANVPLMRHEEACSLT
jgi:hypothetical protein